jgi:asparagine synthase (glutamine-hydrolysing)
VRVLLDGHGGDEVAPAGGGRLNELAAQGRWIKLWHVLDSRLLHGERKLPAYWTFVKAYSPMRRVVRLVRSIRRRLGIVPERPDPLTHWINPDFAGQVGGAARPARQNNRPPGQRVTEQSLQYELLTGPLQSCAFELLDRTAAAAGIEARFAFWDRRLVEFCLSLDPAEKLDEGWGRLILRRAMEGILPPEVQWRRQKFDFTKHLARSIVRDHTQLVMQTLENQDGLIGSYVDLSAARAMMNRLIETVAQPDGYEVQVIFRIIVLAFWLRRQHKPALAHALA